MVSPFPDSHRSGWSSGTLRVARRLCAIAMTAFQNSKECLMKIRAAVARAPDQPFEIISCDLVEPGPGEVLVKMVSCGICHLDIAVKAQHSPPTLPRILGHEGAGVVERVGPGVTNLICGDHVLLSYGSCGECSSCVSGAPAYCAHTFAINFLGERDEQIPTRSAEFRYQPDSSPSRRLQLTP